MDAVLTILREVRRLRAQNARHDLSAILRAFEASRYGVRTCVDFADFGEAHAANLEIVGLSRGVRSHECFSLDLDEVAGVRVRFIPRDAGLVWARRQA